MTLVDRAARYKVSFRVAWDDGESFFTAAISNISETGLYLETTMPLAVGRQIVIIPLVDDAEDEGLFELRGTVVRQLDVADADAGAIAVKFDAMRPAALTDLRRLLDRYRL